jgi:hypothetical protein
MPAGFSTDGFIIDQNCFAAYPYRTITSDINGCGWIAAYNLRHALGQAADFDAVRAEMDGMFLIKMPGPTTMRVMLRYLGRYVPSFRLARGRSAALTAAGESAAGIFRYREEGIPHFVTYVRNEGDRFRFFNVSDGLEDYCCGMETFLREHCARGYTRVMAVDH